MEPYTVFAVDPRGYKVLCNEAQLVAIYEHHPELRNFASPDDMKKAIEDATVIFQSTKSTKGKIFNLYYLSKPRRNIELKVVVNFVDGENGILWAAQPVVVGQRKPGEIMIWPQTKS